jgi:DMSO reductase family type II enzyme chaperone
MPAVAADEQVDKPMDWQQTDLYRFFARVFGPPTHECFEFLAQPSAHKSLRDLWHYVECKGQFPEFAWFPTYDLYESAYIALFDVGLPEPVVPLFESAHDKSHPAQEIALENTYFYDVLGLKSDPARSVPDYLITQLEFLAALRFTQENTPDHANEAALARAKSEFLQRHILNWIPQANTKLKRTDAPGFPVLMEMLLQFLRKESAVEESAPSLD